jgi:tetratricopeptide (TPR) repeat protein
MKLSDQASAKALLRAVASAAGKAGLAVVLVACAQARALAASSSCGELGTPFGDYLKDKDKVTMSESFHFTPEVENLTRGKSTEVIGGDINFMLLAYPNHHRALVAMMRLGEKEKTPQPAGAKYSVECYFDRAIRFRPDDIVARMLFANYLAKNRREADASAQLELASKAAVDNPFSHYNIGLIYLEMKKYDRALEEAHKAYGLGFARTELKDRLKSAGRWKEPGPTAAASSPQSNASTAADKPASAVN